jgi:hypothetical protein
MTALYEQAGTWQHSRTPLFKSAESAPLVRQWSQVVLGVVRSQVDGGGSDHDGGCVN